MNSSAQSIHDISYTSIDGDLVSMSSYKGSYVLLVNVASRCGYTSQYNELQELHETHENLQVLGFPCNQFGAQEPGSESEIKAFCSSRFSVDFPMSSKIDVKGRDISPIYQWLCNMKYNQLDDYEVSWNFNKFLIGPNGNLIAYFPSSVNPLSEEINKHIK
jgi:glutathione peroxidase